MSPWEILPIAVITLFLTPSITEGAVFLSSEVSGTSVDPDNPCPGDRLVYTCSTSDGILTWNVGAIAVGTYVASLDDVGETRTPAALPGVEAILTAKNGSVLTSTLTIPSAGIDVANESTISCVDLRANMNSTVLHIIGPPSPPNLSCLDLSDDTNGTVSVTVSWTLSGGGSADSYLINVTTNDPQLPYRGLLNIINASVTQRELTGFQAGYDYTITVHGVNCGSQEGSESEPLTITPKVPATPVPTVCAEYDRTGTLQTIESTWNELDPVNVSANCVDGRDIRASYELSYTSSSGTSIATCVVNGTDCSNGVCRHELQNNITDSRCQPPVPQFNSESVNVTVTAGNIVGRSNPAVPRGISIMTLLTVYVDSTNIENAFVNCTFEPGYSCTIDYGTARQSLIYNDTSTTMGQVATITLSQDLQRDTTYYFIVSAMSSSQCERVQGTFRTVNVGVVVGPVVPAGIVAGPVVGSVAVVGVDVGAVIVIILIVVNFNKIKCRIITMIVLLCLSVIGIPLVIMIAVWYFRRTGRTTGGAHHTLDDTPLGAGVTGCVILTIVLLCLSVIWIPVAIMIAVWYFRKTCDTEHTVGRREEHELNPKPVQGKKAKKTKKAIEETKEEETYSTLQHGKQSTSTAPLLHGKQSTSTAPLLHGKQSTSTAPLLHGKQSTSTAPLLHGKQSTSTAPLLHGKQSTSTAPLLHGKQSTSTAPLLHGKQSTSTAPLLHGKQSTSTAPLLRMPDQNYAELGEGGGGGEEYSRIQCGKPARVVPNPSDPNYSRLNQGASNPSAEELSGMYDEVEEGVRCKPSQKEEKEGKGKRKRQK